MTGRTRVILLGTGTPNSEPDRSGPSAAIVVDDRPYIFDAGPGVVRRAQAAFEKGVVGMEVTRLNRVLLTHLHSDHTAGLPDILLSPWVLGRKEPLHVIGPPGTSSMMENIHNAYSRDIDVRVRGPERANSSGHCFIVDEVKEGIVFEDDLVRVSAFGVRHTTFRDCFGYRIETPDRKIAISGDCVISDDILENYRDLDVLVHEVYSEIGLNGRDPRWQNYHRNAHTSSVELAEALCSVRPELTVLYHQLTWGISEKDLLSEIGKIYDGEVASGRDLDMF